MPNKTKNTVVICYTNEDGGVSRIALERYLAEYLTGKGINRPKWVQQQHDAYLERFRHLHGIVGRTRCPRSEIHIRINAALVKLSMDDKDSTGNDWDS